MSSQVPHGIASLVLILGACTPNGDAGAPPDVEAQAAPARSGTAERPREVDGPPVPNAAALPASAIDFEPFGPVPGTTDDQLAAWTSLVRERFLGDPDDDRTPQLDKSLAALEIVDATPAFINAIRGLDMARGADVVRCSALVDHWYAAQARFQQVRVNGDGTKTGTVAVRSRLTAVDGWVRWWTRKLTTEGSLDRYRTRVASVIADLDRIRKERRGLK